MALLPGRGKTLRRSRDVFCYLCHILLSEARKEKWVSVKSSASHCFSVAVGESAMVSAAFSAAPDHKTKGVFQFPGIAKTLPSFLLIQVIKNYLYSHG